MQNKQVDNMLKQALQSKEIPSEKLVQSVKQEYQQMQSGKKIRLGRPMSRMVLAVACVMFLVLPAFFVITDFFGLQSPNVSPETPPVLVQGDSTTDQNAITNPAPEQSVLLQNFLQSSGHQAAMRWQDFWDNYDRESSFGIAQGADLSGVPERYWSYVPSSMAMVAELTAIMEDYQLRYLGQMLDLRTQDEVRQSIAYAPFFTAEDIFYNGWQFDCGTFHIEGHFFGHMFSMRQSPKDVFDASLRQIRNPEEFTIWAYINTHGQTVLLLQNEMISHIIKETETAFLVLSIFTGMEDALGEIGLSPFDNEYLERAANAIDFSQIRSEIPDLDEERQERRTTHALGISHLVGTWQAGEHVITITAERNLRWSNMGSSGASETEMSDGDFIKQGDISLVGDRFAFEMSGVVTRENDLGGLLHQLDTGWEMEFWYNPETQTLTHADWQEYTHVFVRIS